MPARALTGTTLRRTRWRTTGRGLAGLAAAGRTVAGARTASGRGGTDEVTLGGVGADLDAALSTRPSGRASGLAIVVADVLVDEVVVGHRDGFAIARRCDRALEGVGGVCQVERRRTGPVGPPAPRGAGSGIVESGEVVEAVVGRIVEQTA